MTDPTPDRSRRTEFVIRPTASVVGEGGRGPDACHGGVEGVPVKTGQDRGFASVGEVDHERDAGTAHGGQAGSVVFRVQDKVIGWPGGRVAVCQA
jgi:hypothetical protein